MLQAMLAEGLQRVRCRAGLLDDAERERVIQSGALLERRDLLRGELVQIFDTGWGDVRVDAEFKWHWKGVELDV